MPACFKNVSICNPYKVTKIVKHYIFKNNKTVKNMKRGSIAFLLLVFLVPFISAQFFGNYNSISDLFSLIDAQTIFIAVAFGVFFALIKTVLDKFPAFRGATSGVISLLLSLGMTYGINKWFSLNDILLNVGYSGDVMPYLLIGFAVLFLFFLFKYKGKSLLVLGLLLVGVSFTDLVDSQGFILIAGIVLSVIGLIWIWKRRGRGSLPPMVPPGATAAAQQAAAVGASQTKRKPLWLLAILGIIVGTVGYLISQGIVIIVGVVLVLIGLLGKKVWRGTFAEGRDMSLRRARNAAYQEQYERQLQARKVYVTQMTKVRNQLQLMYDKQKAMWEDPRSPPYAKDAAYNEMKRIITHGHQNGLNLRL